jgi:hypothetical protein
MREVAMTPEASGAINRYENSQVPRQGTVRLAPSDDPIEVAQRMLSSSQLIVHDGDVVIAREVSGVWRGGPGLEAPTTLTLSEYRVSVHGGEDDDHVFSVYDRAIADGEGLAALRQVRLFYSEGAALTLLKDYRLSPE